VLGRPFRFARPATYPMASRSGQYAGAHGHTHPPRITQSGPEPSNHRRARPAQIGGYLRAGLRPVRVTECDPVPARRCTEPRFGPVSGALRCLSGVQMSLPTLRDGGSPGLRARRGSCYRGRRCHSAAGLSYGAGAAHIRTAAPGPVAEPVTPTGDAGRSAQSHGPRSTGARGPPELARRERRGHRRHPRPGRHRARRAAVTGDHQQAPRPGHPAGGGADHSGHAAISTSLPARTP
jgi:hypothetical protein